MTFDRSLLPQTYELLRDLGFQFRERTGKWRTTNCEFHDDRSPSMRVNTESGGWCCMSCGAKGGDAIAYMMARTGGDFVNCAKALGAWRDDGQQTPRDRRSPLGLSARDALEVVASDMTLLFVVAADVHACRKPSDEDMKEFAAATGRIGLISRSYSA